MKCPSPEYLAGYFDGEGCISVNYSYKPERFNSLATAYSISVGITNTYKPIIEAIHREYSGWIGTNGNHRVPGNRMAYMWKATGNYAGRFLTEIEPFLIEKRPRAIAALFHCDTVVWPKLWRSVAPEGVYLRGLVLKYLEAHPNIRGTNECHLD